MNNVLAEYEYLLPIEKIKKRRELLHLELSKITRWDEYRELLYTFPFLDHAEISLSLGRCVEFRAESAWEKENSTHIHNIVEALLPWRKGPFNFLGCEIDAEWRSELKWNRLLPKLPILENKRILDVGCNNGYYMYRMLEHDPKLVVGLDPSSRCYYQFDLFQQTLSHPKLHYDLFGIEDLDLFREFFHIIFCMGVLYHRKDPYTACRKLFDALQSSGIIFLETLIIPGDDMLALCPQERYAKMRNVWFIPTLSCLENWLAKAGFSEIEVVDVITVTVEEQRKTPLAPYESLSDFLDPEDRNKTIEGYSAPIRAVVKAVKR